MQWNHILPEWRRHPIVPTSVKSEGNVLQNDLCSSDGCECPSVGVCAMALMYGERPSMGSTREVC